MSPLRAQAALSAASCSDSTQASPIPQADAAAGLALLGPAALEALLTAVGIISSTQVAWWPDFGCALLGLQPQDEEGLDLHLQQGHVALHLVALDSWEFAMHR